MLITLLRVQRLQNSLTAYGLSKDQDFAYMLSILRMIRALGLLQDVYKLTYKLFLGATVVSFGWVGCVKRSSHWLVNTSETWSNLTIH